jgi:hypothetical protein
MRKLQFSNWHPLVNPPREIYQKAPKSALAYPLKWAVAIQKLAPP